MSEPFVTGLQLATVVFLMLGSLAACCRPDGSEPPKEADKKKNELRDAHTSVLRRIV